jgi:hypothetical protein
MTPSISLVEADQTPEVTNMPTDAALEQTTFPPTLYPTPSPGPKYAQSEAPEQYSATPNQDASTGGEEVAPQLNETVTQAALDLCRCNNEHRCLPEPLPQGSMLRVCFSVAPNHMIDSFDSLYLEQPGVYWDIIIVDGVNVRNDTVKEYSNSGQVYSISTPVDSSFFARVQPPPLHIKGVAVVIDAKEIDPIRRRLEQVNVPFDKQIDLETSEFKENPDQTGQVVSEVKLEDTRNYFWVFGICLGAVTGAVFLAKVADKVFFRISQRYESGE